MRVQAELAVGIVFVEAAEEALFIDSECAGAQITGVDGGVGMLVISSIADRDGQIAGVDFDILVPNDTGQAEVTGGGANVQVRVLGHLDVEADVVVGTAPDAQGSRLAAGLEFYGHLFGPFGVLHVARDAQHRGAATSDLDVARTEAHAQVAARPESGFESAFTGSRRWPANGERWKEDTQAESGKQISHG